MKSKKELLSGDTMETVYCDQCPYLGTRCEMRRLNDRPFDQELLPFFSDTPFTLVDFQQYAEIAVKALPVPKFEVFTPVINNKYMQKESVVLFPMSNLKISEKAHKDIHQIFPNVKHVGLVMNAKDDFLIPYVEREDWTKAIVSRNFDFSFSPNISFYYNQPSCSTVLNRFRVYKTIKDLLDKGIPVVPSVGFLWEDDLKRYGVWLHKSGFEKVYVNIQMVKFDSGFQQVLDQLRLISKYVKADIIVSGVFDIARMKEINKIRKCSYTNSQLHVLSSNRRAWKNGKHQKVNGFDAMFYDDVMSTNIVNYRSSIRKAL